MAAPKLYSSESEKPRLFKMKSLVLWSLAALPLAIVAYFTDLPDAFNDTAAIWAYMSYGEPSVAVLPGSFNRSAMDAIYKGHATDSELQKRYAFANLYLP